MKKENNQSARENKIFRIFINSKYSSYKKYREIEKGERERKYLV